MDDDGAGGQAGPLIQVLRLAIAGEGDAVDADTTVRSRPRKRGVDQRFPDADGARLGVDVHEGDATHPPLIREPSPLDQHDADRRLDRTGHVVGNGAAKRQRRARKDKQRQRVTEPPGQAVLDDIADIFAARGDRGNRSDVVGFQRELGTLAKYVVDMGGDIELFEVSTRVPSWESLRPLSYDDIRRMKLTRPVYGARNYGGSGWPLICNTLAAFRPISCTVMNVWLREYPIRSSFNRVGVNVWTSVSTPFRLMRMMVW